MVTKRILAGCLLTLIAILLCTCPLNYSWNIYQPLPEDITYQVRQPLLGNKGERKKNTVVYQDEQISVTITELKQKQFLSGSQISMYIGYRDHNQAQFMEYKVEDMDIRIVDKHNRRIGRNQSVCRQTPLSEYWNTAYSRIHEENKTALEQTRGFRQTCYFEDELTDFPAKVIVLCTATILTPNGKILVDKKVKLYRHVKKRQPQDDPDAGSSADLASDPDMYKYPGFLPNRGETFYGINDTYGYLLDRVRTVSIYIHTPSVYDQDFPAEISLHLTDKVDASGGSVPFSIRKMDIRLTDSQGKPLGNQVSSLFSTPEGDKRNVEFPDLAEKYKNSDGNGFDYCLKRTYREKPKELPEQIVLQCSAEIEAWGEIFTVNRAVGFHRNSAEMQALFDSQKAGMVREKPRQAEYTVNDYVPAPDEEFVDNNYSSAYLIYKHRALYVAMEPLRVQGSYLNSGCEMTIYSYGDRNYSSEAFTVKAMDMWFTDQSGKKIGVPLHSTFATPMKAYQDKAFEEIPEADKVVAYRLQKFKLKRQYRDNIKELPERINMHCYAQIEMGGECLLVDRTIKLVKSKEKRQ